MEPGVTHLADVVVVGAGIGGMSAALEARAAGATVLVLEATETVGGNAARSSGYLAFADFARQRDQEIEDSPEAFARDMEAEVDRRRAAFGIDYDEELAMLFARRSADGYEFLSRLGIPFGRFVSRPLQHSVTRLVSILDAEDFHTCFECALDRAGISVILRARVRRLLVEAGRVVGVEWEATGDEGRRAARARRAVILAAGGFQANHELRLHYQPQHLAFTPYPGLDTCRGDGHLMGQAIGGELINMTMIPTLVRTASALIEDAIAVDAAGRRFHDEAGPYFDRVEALTSRAGGRAHYVFDARTEGRLREVIAAAVPTQPVGAPTLSTLAETIGCDAAGLEGSVRRWNEFLTTDRDRDPEFGRVVLPADRDGINVPPFYAAPLMLAASLTAGGFRVSNHMEVAHVDGSIIPGLFAVGDCVGGVNPAAGVGGIHLSSAVVLGRVAGRAAAGAS